MAIGLFISHLLRNQTELSTYRGNGVLFSFPPGVARFGNGMRVGGGMMQPKSSSTASRELSVEESVLANLNRNIGERGFDHWFRDKTTLTIRGECVTVGVASPFLLHWMQRQFREPATSAAQSVLGPSAFAKFDVDADLAAIENLHHDKIKRTPNNPQQNSSSVSTAASQNTSTRGKRRLAQLGDFVGGPCNDLALTAARHVCSSSEAGINPLFLHGGVGTGKTHLLEGIARQLRQDFPSLQVLLLTSEAFANYFTQALRERTLPGFRQRFRSVDVLLVDDIDFLDGKRGIQEEFLHTFQQLESHGRQLVLSGDRHPRLLTKLSDELTTRFLSGLVCRIESPDLKTREKIVKQKSAKLNAEITPEALRYVAQRFPNSVRELEGAINCLHTYHKMTKQRIGIRQARHVLAELERDCIRIIRMSDIEQVVCNMFGVRPDDLKSSRRTRSITQPRMLAMFLARKHTKTAYSEIGRYFGGRNHSTVVAAEKRINSLLSNQETIQVAAQTWPVAEVVESLEQQLLAG